MLMGVLNDVPANFLILLAAGAIMILTLWTSKGHARHRNRAVSLSAQGDEGTEQYAGSSVLSRTIVRAALNINAGIERVIRRACGRHSRRFRIRGHRTQRRAVRHDPRHGKTSTSAMLIAIATSLKLPFSTTYVCFMVAMGSSLMRPRMGPRKRRIPHFGRHDRRRRLVHHGAGRIPDRIRRGAGPDLRRGTVASSSSPSCAATCSSVSNFLKRPNPPPHGGQRRHAHQLFRTSSSPTCAKRSATIGVRHEDYDCTALIAVFKENCKVLRDMVKESNDLFYCVARTQIHALLPTLKKLQSGDVNTAHYYVQVVDYTQRNDQGVDAHHAPCVRTYRQQPRRTVEGAGQDT